MRSPLIHLLVLLILQVEELRGKTHAIAFWEGWSVEDMEAVGRAFAANESCQVCVC
jgi:hypothetical protein